MRNFDSGEQAADAMTRGALIAHCTTGLWGIAADPLSSVAMAKLVDLKGTSTRRGFIVVAARPALFDGWHNDEPRVRRFVEHSFNWPVTVVVQRGCAAPDVVVSTQGTVAIRVDPHACVLGLSEALGRPFISTSLNLPGQPPQTNPYRLPPQLLARIDGVFSAGSPPTGTASTLVRLGKTAKILRPGAVPSAAIAAVWMSPT